MPRLRSKSSLTSWLNGGESLQTFLDNSRFLHSQEFGGWVALEEFYGAHEILNLKAQSLEESWSAAWNYVGHAARVLSEFYSEPFEGIELESEDRARILHELGPPPEPCLPLYIFSIDDGIQEIPVYVGQTNSLRGRFRGGHRACVKLLDPKYAAHSKRIYLCQVMMLSDGKGDYLPLEWVRPYKAAMGILDDAEADLIFRFQPLFNVQKKDYNHSESQISFQIVNYSERPDFLKNR